MRFNYDEIIKRINPALILSEQDGFVYFLDTNAKGNFLLQEKADCIIIWSNELNNLSFFQVYKVFVELIPSSLVFPYIDSKEEYDSIKALGGKPFDFSMHFPDEDLLCKDYSKEFGSLIIENKQ